MLTVETISVRSGFGKLIILECSVPDGKIIHPYFPAAVVPFKCAYDRYFLYYLLKVRLFGPVAFIIPLPEIWLNKIYFFNMNFFAGYIKYIHYHIHPAEVCHHVLTYPAIQLIKFDIVEMKFPQIYHYISAGGFFLFWGSKIIEQKLIIPNRICSVHIYDRIVQGNIFEYDLITCKEPVIYISFCGACIKERIFFPILDH